jgi:hypothetical protein
MALEIFTSLWAQLEFVFTDLYILLCSVMLNKLCVIRAEVCCLHCFHLITQNSRHKIYSYILYWIRDSHNCDMKKQVTSLFSAVALLFAVCCLAYLRPWRLKVFWLLPGCKALHPKRLYSFCDVHLNCYCIGLEIQGGAQNDQVFDLLIKYFFLLLVGWD